jgi:replicative DNA helicase
LTINDLDAYLAKLKKKGKHFDIVYLDYITLMKAVGTNNLYEAGKRLAEDVRALSYKYEVSFVSVLQANRNGVSGQQPKLDNTSESMGIAHTADFMASIWREEEDFETNTLRTGIIKNRIGENFGTQMLELDNHLRIREIDAIFEEDSENMNNAIKDQIKEFSILDDIFEGDE